MSRIPPRQSGLPAEVDSLVGRSHEMAAVLERLRAARVVTLTGPGGCGKTRLALRVAALAEADFEDGAGWSNWPRSPTRPWSRPASHRRWACPNAICPRRQPGWCTLWPTVSCW
jgi:hypothetical protein